MYSTCNVGHVQLDSMELYLFERINFKMLVLMEKYPGWNAFSANIGGWEKIVGF